jgi:hypothetical protein
MKLAGKSCVFVRTTALHRTPVFSLPYSVYGKWVGDYWLVSIWRHLTHIGFSLEIKDAWCPALPRQMDESLMEVAVRH